MAVLLGKSAFPVPAKLLLSHFLKSSVYLTMPDRQVHFIYGVSRRRFAPAKALEFDKGSLIWFYKSYD